MHWEEPHNRFERKWMRHLDLTKLPDTNRHSRKPTARTFNTYPGIVVSSRSIFGTDQSAPNTKDVTDDQNLFIRE